MFGLLARLAPIAVMLLGLGSGTVLSSAGWWLWNSLVDNPHLVEVEGLKCTIRTQEAADAAEKAERDRKDAAAEVALQAYLAVKAEDDAARDKEMEDLENDLKRYEGVLADEGRSCPLDQSDLDWLRHQ